MSESSWQLGVGAAKGPRLGGGALGLLGYYVLTLCLAAGLLGLPFFLYSKYPGSGIFYLWLVLALAPPGLMVLWSLRPRWRPWVAPGAVLEESAAPELFALIFEVAASLGEDSAMDVYVTAEPGIEVGRRRKSRAPSDPRWIGLGLPVLAVVGPGELRALLAHALGRYAAQEGSAARDILRGRERVLLSLRDIVLACAAWPRPFSTILVLVSWPLALYARLFLGAGSKSLHRDERKGDAIATRVCEPTLVGRALQCVAEAELVWPAFDSGPFGTAVELGGRPPLGRGFRAYMDTPGIREFRALALQGELEQTEPVFFAAEPPLATRLELLGVTPEPGGGELAYPGVLDLIAGLESIEAVLWRLHVQDKALFDLPAMSWSDFPDRLAATWRKTHAQRSSALEGLNAEQLPATDAAYWKFGRRASKRLRAGHVDIYNYARQTLAASLAVLLLDRGALVSPQLDDVGSLLVGDESLNPWDLVPAVASGELSQEAWQQRCRELGIYGAPLARRDPLRA